MKTNNHKVNATGDYAKNNENYHAATTSPSVQSDLDSPFYGTK